MASEEQQQPQRREEPADECLHKTKVVQFLGRTTPIILQNENGPCPLLAICNVLLLKNNLNLSPDIAEVSQQKLLSLVAERLIDSNSNINNKDAGYVENQQQNISDAIDLLPCLATGIDVNIKFRRIGDFEFTRECAIFDLLDIPLYHGWIVDPQDSETANAIGSKSYNALVGELVALDSRNMEGEPKSTPEEDCIDFAAATTATLGVPSPTLSRARSFEDSPHSISDNQTVRKGDLQEEAELSRILKLSEAELSTTVDDSLIVNAIGGISIHSDSVVVNTNGEISVSSGASSYPNKCMPVPLVETLEVHTGGTDQNFHQQEAAISDDYNALSRDKNNLPSSQTTPAEGVCSLSNTDGGSHINQPASEESRMHFPSDDVVDKTNGENLVQNENAPSPSTRRDPISADESSVVILGGDEKIQKQFTSTANVHEQTDNQSACGTTEASGLSTTNTDLSGGRRLNVVVSADFTPSVDDGEPIYEGEECILDSNTTIYEDREPMYEGEVVLAEQADKDSVDSCNIGFKDELTPQQGELVRNFLKNNANQLTVYGLFCLRDNLKERELCVFFRNNHFSTMFKLDGDLYLLATDQGYINQPDLVWEKLNEVNGDSVFMTSNFKEFKVESHSSGTWDEQNAMASTADYLASIDNSAQGASDLNSDLQLAIALQQQEFEQQPQRQNMQQPSSSGNSRLITGPQAPRTSGRNSSSARHDAKSSKEKCIVMWEDPHAHAGPLGVPGEEKHADPRSTYYYYNYQKRRSPMTSAVEIIASVVGIIGGLSLAFGGWSSLSLGARSLFVTTQFLSGFAMGFTAAYTAIVSLASDTNEWIALGAAGGAGLLFGAVIGFVTSIGPFLLILITGAIVGPYLLLIDAHDGVGLFPADNKLARQEFVVAFLIIFVLVCTSSSKTNEMENHRFKYVVFTAVVGGWMLADGVSRFVGDVALSTVLYNSFQVGGKAALTDIDASAQTLMFLVWGGVALVGVLNQMAMRWGLICYNRVGSHAQLGGPIEESLPELPTGATLVAQHATERVRLVCENCFATVPTGTAFCTECGEAMPGDDMDPNVSISQAQMPSVAMNSTTQAPERWQPIPNRAYVSTTSYVDPKLAKEASIRGDGRSIRFMDAGVQDPDGKLRGYNDNSVAGRPNFYEPSFRSFAMSTYSIANRAAEPVETPNIRKYKMSGSGIFHLVYFLSGIAGVWWLVFLVGFYPQEYYCSNVSPTLPCSMLEASVKADCYSSKVNFDTSSGEGYCIKKVPAAVWLMYSMMVFSEFLNFFLGLLFNFSMWRPIRRGARYMNDFKPPIPKEQWPTVDVFLCHYTEPVSDTMQTLKNCLAMQYPPELLHIFILDDGYTKSVWDANNHFKVSVNTKVIELCGDLRGDLARLMHERVVGPVQDDASLKSWRRQHSSVRELRKEGGKGVQRRDCAVGSLSDDYDYRDRGIARVTFIGRMKPETHHSKAGNINNALFNEGADGKYLLILDNDMKPHPKFLLAVLPFFFSEGEAVDGGGRQYSDDISWNQVSYVQTPQYFEDTPQLTIMGDPCGHKNTIFFDAVQCGRDGFDSAAFAGTNAVFRRQAFDSIGGIQYGTQTEDAYTGNVLHTSGWDSVYFRKDFEGDQKDRIRLCEGAIPETVAASMGQKKRWAKGAVQILLMKNESEVDPDWRPPRVPAPDPKPSLAFPRKMFFWDSVFYPFGSIPALCYVVIAVYYLNTGDAPIYAKGTKFLYSFLPLMLIKWMLNLLANRAVDNNDVWRAQQTWFSYSFITMLAIIEALQARITGKDKSWANTGAGQKTSVTEIPNVIIFFTLLVSQVVALVRFFQYENATNPWNYVSAMFFGFFIASNFYPMVKMSITEYAGWDHTSATFTANIFGSLIMVFMVVFVQLWQVYFEGNLAVARGESSSSSTTTT